MRKLILSSALAVFGFLSSPAFAQINWTIDGNITTWGDGNRGAWALPFGGGWSPFNLHVAGDITTSGRDSAAVAIFSMAPVTFTLGVSQIVTTGDCSIGAWIVSYGNPSPAVVGNSQAGSSITTNGYRSHGIAVGGNGSNWWINGNITAMGPYSNGFSGGQVTNGDCPDYLGN